MSSTSATPHELNASYGKITYPSSSSSDSQSSSFPTSVSITPTPRKGTPTDIWRKPGPPEISTFNAPGLYRKVNLDKFKSVQVSVSAKWNTLYDQGGLVFILPSDTSDQQSGENVGKSSKWVKTGVEFYDNKPLVSTVTRDIYADWSLYPAGISSNASTGEASVTLLIERQNEDDTFWVYVVDSEGKKLPIREVTWVLSDVDGKGVDREAWVGVYAATPKGMEDGDRKELNVAFEDLKWEFR